ncbi:MAG: prepilin peptidase [Patescibacteria group bacterium]|nr:prepilin peptidase [Patescibacteria group bacterium]
MELIFYSILFIFGISVGSFLNCLIYWLENKKRKNLFGRSFCPNCLHKLGFFDLIPILSFIFLKGKCRYCGKRISWQYPAVEIATGGLFLLISNSQFSPISSRVLDKVGTISNEFLIFNFQTFLNLFYLFIVSSFLIIIFVYDLKHYLIPDKIIYSAIGIVFLYRLVTTYNLQLTTYNFEPLIYAFLSAFSAGAFFFLIWFLSRGKWMGFGDVKLAFLIGLFLSWPNILVSLFSAFLIGAIIGLGLLALGKKNLKSEVPFGPFLVTGTFIGLFLGEKIIRYYLSLV